ncbi:MAG: hypothetical protein QXK24_09040 [Ignisphaera sp.]
MLSLKELKEASSEDFASFVRAIKILGPKNYAALSKFTGLPVETVRHRVKNLFVRRSVSIRIHVDRGKLGLARYWLMLKFADDFNEDSSVSFLEHLAKYGYLEYYGRLIPRGGYAICLSLPARFEFNYRAMLDKLVDMNFIENYSMYRVNWIRYLSMREDCYDFKRGVWSFNWNELPNVKSEDISIEEDTFLKPRIDEVDLWIVASLQANALASIQDIAETLKINYKKILYHFKEHVIKNGIIKKYILVWNGGVNGEKLTYMLVMVKDVDVEDLRLLEKTFSRIPFTFFDTYSNDARLYTAFMLMPIEHLQNCLNFIFKSLPKIRSRVFYELIDLNCSKVFAIPLELFIDGQWRFNVSHILRRVYELVKTPIKSEDVPTHLVR